MILVDTSVWIDHLHHVEPGLVSLLGDGLVLTHDGVIHEIALGSVARREAVLSLLSKLSRVPNLRHSELLRFVDDERLWGKGLSPIDIHLLGSARLAGASLWTRDKRLRTAANSLGIVVRYD